MLYRSFLKRFFDLFFSISCLILMFPLFLILMVLIRINLGKPIFFLQERGGQNGSKFKLFKFRTMLNDYDAENNLLPDECRLTKFGAFLRSYSLDELPSLWNVIRGEMSIIGPRPFIAEYLPLYNDFQKQRHLVKPGITGWAQINGRNSITWQEKFELDVWYVKHQSFTVDLKILWLTFLRVIKRKGISNENHATMPKFVGE